MGADVRSLLAACLSAPWDRAAWQAIGDAIQEDWPSGDAEYLLTTGQGVTVTIARHFATRRLRVTAPGTCLRIGLPQRLGLLISGVLRRLSPSPDRWNDCPDQYEDATA